MALDLFGPTVVAGGVTLRPSETRSFTATDTFFRDCSSPDLDDGTEFAAAWFNEVTATLRGLARGNGQTVASSDVVTQDNADDLILLRAMQHLIQRGQAQYGEDTSSTVNVMAVALTPAPPEYKKGMRLSIKAANSNTGAAKLAINGLAPITVVRPDGSTLLDSDIAQNSVNEYTFDGTFFQLMGANARPVLKRNTTIYVNGAIGNDANDGTANVAGSALATIQGAINLAFRYVPSQFAITVLIAPGVYAAAATPSTPGPTIIIDGQSTSSVTISASSTYCLSVSGPNTLTVKNLTVQNSGANGGFSASSGAAMVTVNTASNVCGTSAGVFAVNGGTIQPGNHTFAGNASAMFYASFGGSIQLSGETFTIASSITMGGATAVSTTLGAISASSSSPPTFVNPGNVAGTKFIANVNGVINAAGLGLSFFPGSVAGTTPGVAGGQYNP